MLRFLRLPPHTHTHKKKIIPLPARPPSGSDSDDTEARPAELAPHTGRRHVSFEPEPEAAADRESARPPKAHLSESIRPSLPL